MVSRSEGRIVAFVVSLLVHTADAVPAEFGELANAKVLKASGTFSCEQANCASSLGLYNCFFMDTKVTPCGCSGCCLDPFPDECKALNYTELACCGK